MLRETQMISRPGLPFFQIDEWVCNLPMTNEELKLTVIFMSYTNSLMKADSLLRLPPNFPPFSFPPLEPSPFFCIFVFLQPSFLQKAVYHHLREQLA